MSVEQSYEITSQNCKEEFDHKIQFQLYDGFNFPVDGTQFWVTLKIIKEGKKVTIQLPTINFQTGPIATDDDLGPLPGGTLRTSDGFLPKEVYPSDPVYRSYLGASNNGMSLPFSFTTPPQDLPVPPVGYIISVTFYGGIIIQCAGTFINLIPPGPQIVLPTDITYLVEKKEELCKNFPISTGASNITQFTGRAANDGYRDTHVNDAFDGTFAWTWTDNSNIADKTNNTLNAWVAVGRVKDGKLKLRPAIQLSNLAPGIMAWDTAVAINRTDKNNIVVSYGVLNHNISPTGAYTYRAVSFDGGKTWPAFNTPLNGLTNIQPTGPRGFGDNRGVASDKFGNIWYSTTNYYDNLGNFINTPTFWISTDKGVTFSVAYTAPLPIVLGVDAYDYPQLCFGGDGQGNYGLWWATDYFTAIDIIPVVGFIPITGLGTYGTGTLIFLYSLINMQYTPCLTASEDGRVWCVSDNVIPFLFQPSVVRFKSPGPIDSNYAGPWHLNMLNDSSGYGVANFISYPAAGYFNGTQTIIYDEKRQALYALFAQQAPDYSQNMRIYLVISRNNGQTWSNPFYISNSNFANRGFPSMALDNKTEALIFGWYDGRNDKTEQSVQYLGAVLPKKQLNKMVEAIPLSNPLFTLPPATTPLPPTEGEKDPKAQKLRNIIREQLLKY